ncbi:hypothetical protein AMTR_s04537p00007420, partial [Amborella trichopoda]
RPYLHNRSLRVMQAHSGAAKLAPMFAPPTRFSRVGAAKTNSNCFSLAQP